jgi:hypothetical protein
MRGKDRSNLAQRLKSISFTSIILKYLPKFQCEQRLENPTWQPVHSLFITLILFAIFIAVFFALAVNVPVQAESIWRTWTVNKQGVPYHLQYSLTNGSKVADMVMGGYENKSLVVSINSTSNGAFTIRLPRELIDYNPPPEGQSAEGYSHFSVFIDEIGSQPFDELEITADFRTLKINFQTGAETIVIHRSPYVGLPTVFAPLDRAYDLTIENQRYPIKYGFSEGSTGTVDSIVANVSSKSITIMISDYSNDSTTSDWQKRVFSIELPRNIINANTTEDGQGCSYSEGGYVVWSQEHDIEYKIDVYSVGGFDAPKKYEAHFTMEECGQDIRTLSVEYPSGKSMVVIQGTVMIPEFATNAALILMVVSIAGGVAVWRLKKE